MTPALTQIHDHASQLHAFTYLDKIINGENRLTAIAYSDGATPGVSYHYDANGNRTQMQDGTGQTTYIYDEQDRLTSVTSPGSPSSQTKTATEKTISAAASARFSSGRTSRAA